MKTIREAANALCDRWDTPLWKDADHTAVFIHELRAALANHCEDDLNMDHIGDAAELVQPEQIKYRRGDWLRCLETDDVCVVHMSGSANQWVKFPDGDVLSYTNEQVTELFDKINKECDWEGIAADQAMTIALMKSEQEPVAWLTRYISGELDFDEPNNPASVGWSAAFPVYEVVTQAQRQPLTDDHYTSLAHRIASRYSHRTAPSFIAYTFLPHTLEQFVRAIEAAPDIKAQP